MLYFLPSPIGNLGDISLRVLDILKRCELAFCEDTRSSSRLFFLLNEKYSCDIHIKELIPLHSHNEAAFAYDIDTLKDKEIAVLCDAGMPTISDPGLFLLRFARNNDLPYEVIPGANAALTALVISGLSEGDFYFAGFLNVRKNRAASLEALMQKPCAVILYEASSRIFKLVQDIAEINSQKELFAVKEISKLHEQRFFGQASEVAKELEISDLRGEWVLVLAPNKANEEKGISPQSLSRADIKELLIAPKTKAKLLAKLSNTSIKDEYEALIRQDQ